MITLSNNNPIKRNLEIIKIIKPKVVFVDKQNYNYLSKNNLKRKLSFGRSSYKEDGIKKKFSPICL